MALFSLPSQLFDDGNFPIPLLAYFAFFPSHFLLITCCLSIQSPSIFASTKFWFYFPLYLYIAYNLRMPSSPNFSGVINFLCWEIVFINLLPLPIFVISPHHFLGVVRLLYSTIEKFFNSRLLFFLGWPLNIF